ncbi:MAG: methyltransferase domain-containing protein [Kibdelosporangium sp.]
MTETAELYGESLFAHDHHTEAVRLDALARMLDPVTRARLSALVRPGMRCVDIGAGLGRISAWLSEQVAPGEVIALDRDVRLLGSLPAVYPTVEVIEADITEPGLEIGTFDLVHARLVLMHLRNREEVFRRLLELLAPGGWIVLGESVKAAAMTSSPDSPYRRLMELHWATLERSIGSDPQWGLRYPDLFRQAGLTDIGVDMYHPAVTSTSPAGLFFQLNFRHLRDRILADGLVDEELFEAGSEAMLEPGFADVGMGVVTAWARKPR